MNIYLLTYEFLISIMEVARKLFQYTQQNFPQVYQEILDILRPHSVEGIMRLFAFHLKKAVEDLCIFNDYPERIPKLLLEFVRSTRKRFPSPGDAFGIQLTCRLTKADTQGTLDSKHVKIIEQDLSYNVNKAMLYEIRLYTSQSQVFELATRHEYSSVFTNDPQVPDMCVLERGMPFNKARDDVGNLRYLSTFDFIRVGPDRIMYKTARQLDQLLKRLDNIEAFTDLRYVYKKCGIVAHFFNLIKVLEKTLSDLNTDVITVVKYQCRTGQPLPLTRDGLAKNMERSPIEVLSFEAPKKNFTRLCTMPKKVYRVESSTDKIFFGQQFIEGTGYKFDVRPKQHDSKFL